VFKVSKRLILLDKKKILNNVHQALDGANLTCDGSCESVPFPGVGSHVGGGTHTNDSLLQTQIDTTHPRTMTIT